ncbi:MAG: ABC transporter permease subunit [Alphaproteobacteria bacterium]|nr:ABC transporter permease subunit [Alphaproteobacteria bacterium]
MTPSRPTSGGPGSDIPPRKTAFGWNSPAVRAFAWQAVILGAVVALGAWFVWNALSALAARGIATGFGFLETPAGFDISESPIPFSPSDSYLRAYAVAVLNTVKVSVLAIVFATLLGTFVGIARLSTNWLVARCALLYVELFRNTPQLLQIVFWYVVISRLPRPRQALAPIDGVFFHNRGLNVAVPAADPLHLWMFAAFVAGCAGAWLLRRHARARGRLPRSLRTSLALVIGPPLLVWLAGGAPLAWDVPRLQGFNFRGGFVVNPEFLALMLGLSLYIAAFIAEIVRSGIQSVGRGQTEAARSLGLGRGQIYRLVVLPQALRVMVPPATNQYVSLTKNSTLGVAIGYPEIINIGNTTISQTGHTVEGIAMIMVFYLALSFAISGLMNLYNRRLGTA